MPFDSPLELRHRPGHYRWELISALTYTTLDGRAILMPAGALTDLGSIPRFARPVVDAQRPTTRRPSAIHDYIYTHLTHRFTKQEADRIFYEALLEEDTGKSLAWMMWQAVRVGGRGAWRQA
jgi:hypothetical protein